jgi:hypothetical protein
MNTFRASFRNVSDRDAVSWAKTLKKDIDIRLSRRFFFIVN